MTPAAARALERLRELATLGATGNGIDRPLFSAAERAARERFAAWSRAAGLDITQDRSGNTFARRVADGTLPAIACGSHLDTVIGGGWLDGAYGVIGALAAIEQLADEGIATRHPLTAIAWAGEEGSRFPLGCLGSGFFCGLNAAGEIDALQDPAGVGFAQARDGAHGLLPDVATIPPQLPAAYLELHIEQGPVLEHAGARLGVVTAIAGQIRAEIVLGGVQGHAGTVPMALRHDALAAAAEIVLALETLGRTTPESVVTVGYLVVEPNQTNVIPGQVTLRVDARSVDPARLATLERETRAIAERVARERGVTLRTSVIEQREPVAMDARLRAVLDHALGALTQPLPALPSGAGHDAMCLARVVPAAMIFVPSIGGRSHVAAEDTAPEDLELGITALARALAAVDRRLTEG